MLQVVPQPQISICFLMGYGWGVHPDGNSAGTSSPALSMTQLPIQGEGEQFLVEDVRDCFSGLPCTMQDEPKAWKVS